MVITSAPFAVFIGNDLLADFECHWQHLAKEALAEASVMYEDSFIDAAEYPSRILNG